MDVVDVDVVDVVVVVGAAAAQSSQFENSEITVFVAPPTVVGPTIV